MSAKAVHFQIRIRRTLDLAMRNCFRFVCNHPLLVTTLCLLFLMYRLSPFLFNLLLTASPILVCTASLLGTLLMFGKPDIPEVEKDKVDTEFSSDEMSCKNEVQRDSSVAENQYELIQNVQDNGLDMEIDSFPQEAVDSDKGQHLGSSTQKDEDKNAKEEESEEDIDDDDDDDSDQAESWSPDASMADIAPMLDELHPLLDLETPLPSHVSHDGSDASSERSIDKSDGSSDQSSEESSDESDEEDQDEEELDRDDDNVDEDEDEECEAQEGKEDESKKVITWTEDDQKNLMDLGSLELERNQRLETLIARRRARKTLSMMPERNLIDFESADLPFNIPSISTRRQNPFDISNDIYDNFGLPPIPGSAPSFLATRRNPFDIPYDSNEEKPDLKGDGFEEEFFTAPQKETAIFRRHESFSIGPSSLAGNRRERLDARLRPIFMPEEISSGETNYGSIHRQLSEISESKGSSVPDTDSVTSIVEQYDKKSNNQDFFEDADAASHINFAEHVEHGSQSSEDAETIYDEQLESEQHHDEAEITLGGVNSQQEIEGNYFECQESTTSVFHVDETSERREPSEEDDSSSSSSSSLSEGYKYVTGIREEEESLGVDVKSDLVQDNSNSKQSSSDESYCLNENMRVHDNKNVDEEEKAVSKSVDHRDYLIQNTSISTQSSLEESQFSDASLLVDGRQNADVEEDEGSTSVDFRGKHAQETNKLRQNSAEETYFDDASMLVDVNQTYDAKEKEGSNSTDLRGDLVHETTNSKQRSPKELFLDGTSLLVDDKRSSDMQKEGLSSVDHRGDHFQETSISKQPSPEELYFDDASMLVDDGQNSDLKEEEGSVDLRGDLEPSPVESYFNDASTLLDDSQHKEPVYDSSPQAVDRFLSFKSVSSDMQAELSEMCSTPNSLDMNVASSDRVSDKSVEMGTPDKERMSSASSQVYTADGSSPSSSSKEGFEVVEHYDIDGVAQKLDDQNGSDIQKHVHDDDMSPDSTFLSGNGSAEKAGEYEEETLNHVDQEQDQVSSLHSDAGADVRVNLNANVKSGSTIDGYQKPSEEANMSKLDEQRAELVINPVEADRSYTVSSEIVHKEKHEKDKEEADEQDLSLIHANMISERNSDLHELDQAHPSVYASQEVLDTNSAPELSVPVMDSTSYQEQQPSIVNEKAPEFHASEHSEKIERIEENSVIEGDVISSEPKKVHMSSSDEGSVLSSEPKKIHVASSDIVQLSEQAKFEESSFDAKINSEKIRHTEENSVIEGDVHSSEQDKAHVSGSDDHHVLSTEPNENHLSSSDIVLSSEEAEVDVSSSDVEINADLHQYMNTEADLSSGHQQMSSKENALSTKDTGLSSPDESMGEQSLSDHEKK